MSMSNLRCTDAQKPAYVLDKKSTITRSLSVSQTHYEHACSVYGR